MRGLFYILCGLSDGLELFDERREWQGSLDLGRTIAEDSRTFERLLAAHDEQVRIVVAFSETELFGERLGADVLGERDARFAEIFGETYRDAFRFVADMHE